jgi:hypothetical protein
MAFNSRYQIHVKLEAITRLTCRFTPLIFIRKVSSFQLTP